MSDQISLIKQLGSNGIACLGLATEVNKLEFSEKKKIIELVSDITNNSIPVVVTISGKNINEYKKLIDVAQLNNASWIVLQPLLNKSRLKFIEENQMEKIIAFEIPLLYETGANKWLDYIISVYCSKKTQMQRLYERKNFNKNN